MISITVEWQSAQGYPCAHIYQVSAVPQVGSQVKIGREYFRVTKVVHNLTEQLITVCTERETSKILGTCESCPACGRAIVFESAIGWRHQDAARSNWYGVRDIPWPKRPTHDDLNKDNGRDYVFPTVVPSVHVRSREVPQWLQSMNISVDVPITMQFVDDLK